jgi:hypothetical protein
MKKQNKVRVMFYKGYVSIEASLDAPGLLNNPAEPGQLGWVVDASEVQFSKKSVEALQKVRRSRDCIGDVDIFSANDPLHPNTKVVFCWMGGPKKAFLPEEVEGSSTYDAYLVDKSYNKDFKARCVKNSPSKSFMEFVDNKLSANT